MVLKKGDPVVYKLFGETKKGTYVGKEEALVTIKRLENIINNILDQIPLRILDRPL